LWRYRKDTTFDVDVAMGWITEANPDGPKTQAFSCARDTFVGNSSLFSSSDKHTEFERVGHPVPVEPGTRAYTSGIAHQGPTCISAPT
jgi:hypothetical protein